MRISTSPSFFVAAAMMALVFLIGCGQGQAQPPIGLVWDPVVTVAPNANDNMKPQLAMFPNARPAVLWGSQIGSRKGWLAVWNGTGFNSPNQINPTGAINAFTVEGPGIAAKGDTAYMVYTVYPTTAAAVMVRASTDGGVTWGVPTWVDSLGTDLPAFSNVTIGQGGEAIVTYIRQTSTYANPRYVVRRSTDLGQTWTPEVEASLAAPGGEVCDCCTSQPYWVDGKLVIVFRNNAGSVRDMWAVVSMDGGDTFTQAIDLDSTDWVLNACPSSGPNSVFVGDSIFTVFMSQGGNGLARVWLSAASMSTGQLGYNRMLSDTLSNFTQNYPSITAKGDTMVVAWYENNGGNPEIALRYSFTGSAGLWSRPVISASGMVNGVQTNPDLLWHNGRLHLVWQDDATNTVKYRSATVGEMVGMAGPQANLRIYPQPSHGPVRIDGLDPNASLLGLVDLSGRWIGASQYHWDGVGRLDLMGLPAGVYSLVIQTGQGFVQVMRLTHMEP